MNAVRAMPAHVPAPTVNGFRTTKLNDIHENRATFNNADQRFRFISRVKSENVDATQTKMNANRTRLTGRPWNISSVPRDIELVG